MKKAVVLALVGLMVIGGLVWAKKLTISPNNPLFTPTIDLYPLIKQTREFYGVEPIEIYEGHPFTADYIQLCYMIGFNTQAIAQMLEWLSIHPEGVTSLEQLTTVSFWGSPRSLFKLLVFFKFQDEEKMAEDGFFKVKKPQWWGLVPDSWQ